MFKQLVLITIGLCALSACGSSTGSGANAAAPAAQTASAPPSTATAVPAETNGIGSARQYQLGADYLLIDPRVPTSTGDKVEVVEVFSYACPHCAHFQPYMDQLKARLPAQAQLVLVPAVFNPSWEPFARAYYAAKSLGIVDKTHQALFDALHRDHMPITEMPALASFYAGYGVTAANFLSTANSFVVDGQIAHGNQLVRDYGVAATPTLVVNGKYRVEMSPEKHIGPDEAIAIVQQLVKQELAAQGKPTQ